MKEKQTVRLRDRSMCKLIRRMAAERPMGIIGMVILLVLFITAVFANQLAPYEMNQIDLLHMLDGATPAHPLGTDNLGRDILSNIIYGARISVIIGFAATAVMLLIAVLIGTSSAVLGGAYDMVVQRFVDAWQCIPNMLVLMMAMSIVGRGTPQLILAIGIPMGISTSRVVRSAVISLRSNLYLEAADILGASTWRIVYRHIIPNIAPILIISAATQIGQVILMEFQHELLGHGRSPRSTQLGQHAQPGGPGLHGAGSYSGTVAGPGADSDRIWSQHVRRCAPGSARSQAERGRGALRQTSHPEKEGGHNE